MTVVLVTFNFFVNQVREKITENPSAETNSLIILELNLFFEFQLIGVNFGVKAVIGFQNYSKIARAEVDRAPRGDGFSSIEGSGDIIESLLAKALDGFTLFLSVAVMKW